MKAISFAAGLAVAAVACGALYAEADDYWIATQGSVSRPDSNVITTSPPVTSMHCPGQAGYITCTTGGMPPDPERLRICAKGAAAAGRPPADEWKRMKNAALDRAAIPRKRSGEYEYDHIIPRCLGGSNDPDNLQLQTWDVARVKDDLERFVCRQYCDGKISLDDARGAFTR
jgi:hypothetical protein